MAEMKSTGIVVGECCYCLMSDRLRRVQVYTVYNFEVEALNGNVTDRKLTYSYFVRFADGGLWFHNGKI